MISYFIGRCALLAAFLVLFSVRLVLMAAIFVVSFTQALFKRRERKS